MKTRNTPNFFIMAGVLLLLYSCGKEIDQFIPDVVNFDFEQEFGVEASTQAYVVDGRLDTIIFTPRGTEFEIFQNTFQFENGEECLCETIEFDITEYNRPGDFILDPTIDGTPGGFTAVEGLYHVSAKSEGKNLELMSDVELHYHDPSDLDLGYGLLYADGPNSWSSLENLPGRSGEVYFSSSIDGYEVSVDQIGWSGIGKDLTYLGTTEVCLDLDLLTHDQNAQVYAIGKTKLLVKSFHFDSTKECFCGELPLDIDVDLVVIRKNTDGIYQFAKQGASVTPELEVHMMYEPGTKSQSEIIAIIKGL